MADGMRATGESYRSRSKWWSGYFVFMTLFALADLVAMAVPRLAPELPRDWLAWIDILTSLVALVGLYGYVWDTPIGPRKFWQATVPLYILLNVVSAARFLTKNRTGAPESYIAVLLIVPLFWGLYRYAFPPETA